MCLCLWREFLIVKRMSQRGVSFMCDRYAYDSVLGTGTGAGTDNELNAPPSRAIFTSILLCVPRVEAEEMPPLEFCYPQHSG